MPDGLKYYGVAWNYLMQDFMMHFSRQQRNWIFAPGYSSKDLIRTMTEKLDGRQVYGQIDGDGSAWDSWQHSQWLTIDTMIMEQMYSRILDLYPEDLFNFEVTIFICSSAIARFALGYDNATTLNVMVVGLTFSGHSTRTTVGNTWRCYLRIIILMFLSNNTHYLAIIGGDDNSIFFLEPKGEQRYREELAKATQGKSSMMLGLLLKNVEGINTNYNNFYSKNMA